MGQLISSLNNNDNEELYDNLSKLQAKLDNENIQKDVLSKLNQELENKILKIKELNDLEIIDLLKKYDTEKKEKDDLLKKYDTEKKEKDDLLEKYDTEKKEKDDLLEKYDTEKKEKDDLLEKYETEIRENEINSLNLIKEFKIEQTSKLKEYEKNEQILENKIKFLEDEVLKFKNINKKQEIDMKGKLDGINNMVDYYKNNSNQIIEFILNKNNNIIPDYFEKEIITNTYNSLIDMICNNLKKVK